MATKRELAKYNSVALPPTIPCNECKIQKKPNQYSANRLADLQKMIITAKANKRAFDPKSQGFVRCSLCVGGQKVEHECYHCEITYPRNDRYFSKSMLKNRKDEALCWSCSEREQNKTLSSDNEDGGGSDSGSDGSTATFVTNQFHDIDLDSTTSGGTSASRSNGFSSRDDSSGGVRLNGSKTPGTGGGTIYAGSASNMGSSRVTTTSPSIASSGNAQMLSFTRYSPSVASSGAASSVKPSGGFNRNAYGRCRSPTSSEASTKSGSTWAKPEKPRTAIAMDAVHEQHKDMRYQAAEKKKASESDCCVSDDDSD